MHIKVISFIITAVTAVLGHVEITQPCPRYSNKCATTPELPPGEVIDYNLNAPIGSNGNILAPFCHHTTPWPQPTETWTAGQPVTFKFYKPVATTHHGGHCEFSIMYPNSTTYLVLHQELRYCFYTGPPDNGGQDTVREYTFNLPTDLPGTPHAVAAWTFVNSVGAREFYALCGDIAVIGPAGALTGKAVTIVNYGSNTVLIPEFLGNYDTGISYYTTNTTNVTVVGEGFGGYLG
ncbi:hypothetical protein IW139_002224, partial [Coemansia sp. RSA 353]